MNQPPSDDTIQTADLQKIHNLIAKYGIDTPQNRLAERESALAAYVIYSADEIARVTRIAGAPPPLVRWIKGEVTARLLVVIEAQQVAQYQLWREFMGDPAHEPDARNPRNTSKGDTDGRTE